MLCRNRARDVGKTTGVTRWQLCKLRACFLDGVVGPTRIRNEKPLSVGANVMAATNARTFLFAEKHTRFHSPVGYIYTRRLSVLSFVRLNRAVGVFGTGQLATGIHKYVYKVTDVCSAEMPRHRGLHLRYGIPCVLFRFPSPFRL